MKHPEKVTYNTIESLLTADNVFLSVSEKVDGVFLEISYEDGEFWFRTSGSPFVAFYDIWYKNKYPEHVKNGKLPFFVQEIQKAIDLIRFDPAFRFACNHVAINGKTIIRTELLWKPFMNDKNVFIRLPYLWAKGLMNLYIIHAAGNAPPEFCNFYNSYKDPRSDITLRPLNSFFMQLTKGELRRWSDNICVHGTLKDKRASLREQFEDFNNLLRYKAAAALRSTYGEILEGYVVRPITKSNDNHTVELESWKLIKCYYSTFPLNRKMFPDGR